MTLDELQRRVDDWIGQWEEGYFPPLLNLARLTEETGELARVLAHAHGKRPKPGELGAELAEELADVLFVLVCLANQHGLKLSDACEAMLHKLASRDARRWTPKNPPT